MDRSLLNRATASTDEPTPGYLYNEISQMSYSSPDACYQLEDYLMKKLVSRSNDCVVILKCLKVIRHICNDGKLEFKRSIQRRADQIRQFQAFRGKPDALRGDQPSQAVRDEADICVKAIFSQDSTSSSYSSVDTAGRIQGFGNNDLGRGNNISGSFASGNYEDRLRSGVGTRTPGDYCNPSFVEGGRCGRMTGFGNPHFDFHDKGSGQEPTARYIAEAAMKYVPETVKQQLDKLGLQIPWSNEKPQDGFPNANIVDPPIRTGRSVGSSPWIDQNQGTRPSAPRISLITASSGEFESKLVGDVCRPGGAKVAPPPSVLNEFVRKCSSLDMNCIANLLLQKLSTIDSWQTRLKVLCAIEALLADSRTSTRFGSYLSSLHTNVFQELNETVPQCKDKTEKIMQLLGVYGSESNVSEDNSAMPRKDIANIEGKGFVDLLDISGDEPSKLGNSEQSSFDSNLNHPDDLMSFSVWDVKEKQSDQQNDTILLSTETKADSAFRQRGNLAHTSQGSISSSSVSVPLFQSLQVKGSATSDPFSLFAMKP